MAPKRSPSEGPVTPATASLSVAVLNTQTALSFEAVTRSEDSLLVVSDNQLTNF